MFVVFSLIGSVVGVGLIGYGGSQLIDIAHQLVKLAQ